MSDAKNPGKPGAKPPLHTPSPLSSSAKYTAGRPGQSWANLDGREMQQMMQARQSGTPPPASEPKPSLFARLRAAFKGGRK